MNPVHESIKKLLKNEEESLLSKHLSDIKVLFHDRGDYIGECIEIPLHDEAESPKFEELLQEVHSIVENGLDEILKDVNDTIGLYQDGLFESNKTKE